MRNHVLQRARIEDWNTAVAVSPRVPLILIFVFSLAVAGLQTARCQDAKPSEYQVKAVYLYNFGHFVEWPEATAAKSNSFGICILGRDPFGPILDSTIAGESIGGKNVIARRISKAQETLDCRILFISASEDNHLKDDLNMVDRMGVLTVSDAPHFLEGGGMIQFVADGNKVRFEVNVSNAADAGLALSSDLLKVAHAVRKNPQPGE
jgi:hypothetical protein